MGSLCAYLNPFFSLIFMCCNYEEFNKEISEYTGYLSQEDAYHVGRTEKSCCRQSKHH